MDGHQDAAPLPAAAAFPQDLFFYRAALALGAAAAFFNWRPPSAFAAAVLILAFCGARISRRAAWFSAVSPALPFFSRSALLIALITAAASWTAVFILKYFSLGYHTFDTGFFAQVLAYAAEHGRLINTFSKRHAFSDHFSPSLLVLAPLFKIYPTFMWLIAAKLAAFIACPLLLAAAASRLSLPQPAGGNRWFFFLPMLFVFHPYAANTLAFEFQPSALAMPFVICAFLFAAQSRIPALIAVLVIAAGFKEHLCLLPICAGLYLVLELNRRRAGLLLILGGIAAAFAAAYFILPEFNHGRPPDWFGIVRPSAFIVQKTQLFAAALASVGFLPLLAPCTAAAVLPAFGAAFASSAPIMLGFDYHYQDLPLVCLLFAALQGLIKFQAGTSWLNRAPQTVQQTVFAFSICCWAFFIENPPLRFAMQALPDAETLALHEEAKRAAEALPRATEIWIVQRLSVFFVGHPRLRSIDQYKTLPVESSAAAGDGARAVIITDRPETSSLPPDMHAEILRRLELRVQEGRCRMQPGFRLLRVCEYQSPSPKP